MTAAGKVEVFLHSTKLSKKPADRWILMLETILFALKGISSKWAPKSSGWDSSMQVVQLCEHIEDELDRKCWRILYDFESRFWKVLGTCYSFQFTYNLAITWVCGQFDWEEMVSTGLDHSGR